MSKSRLDKKEMENKLAKNIYYLLMPHDIRVKAFDTFQSIEK